ncbi:MAG: hypothetical protein K5872_03910 [Rhizobiaceae bacterium]|nr:hypothetical protein [Rhizobiaceae bacterium]MCV0405357.1 hypothetical protein [Rhizobiaceae bacterium]
MRMPTAIAAIAGLCIPVPALAADDGNRGDLTEAMIREGAAPAQAACLVEKLGDDGERLFAIALEDLTGNDRQLVMTAMDACSDVDGGE